MNPTIFYQLFTSILAISTVTSAFAQPAGLSVPPKENEPPKETIHALTLKPVGTPLPLLKYELLPNFRDLTRNNAATMYHRAMMLYAENFKPGKESNEARMKLEDSLSKPVKDLPKADLQNFIKPFNNVFRELEAASLCNSCDWGLTDRISVESIGLLLPEVQKCRELAFLLKVRIRLALAEGNVEKAIRDIQTGFKLGENIGRGETLINFLVGTAIVTVMINELEQVIQIPNAPNFYWALTVLPRPILSLQKPMEGELRSIDTMIPLPRDIDKPMTTEQARLALDQVWTKMQQLHGEFQLNAFPKLGLNESRMGLAAYITLQYPKAKQRLIAAGKPEAIVNAMPAAQVVLLESSLRYQNLRDEYMLWMVIPYEEARFGMKFAEEKLQQVKKEPFDFFITMLNLLLPATQKVYDAQLRTQRRIASLRVVEAVRLHTAMTGKSPQKLEDVTIVPIPIDPATGKLFKFLPTDQGFTVIVDAPPGQTANLGNAWKYQVQWAK